MKGWVGMAQHCNSKPVDLMSRCSNWTAMDGTSIPQRACRRHGTVLIDGPWTEEGAHHARGLLLPINHDNQPNFLQDNKRRREA